MQQLFLICIILGVKDLLFPSLTIYRLEIQQQNLGLDIS